MTTGLKRAPYDRNGRLINYLSSYPGEVPEWRDNKPFPAMLILTGTTRGMSAARFTWRSDEGHIYEMFMTDAVGLMKGDAPIWHGTVDTWWMVQKRGKNYGIRKATLDDLQRAGHISGPKADCPACDGVTYGYEPWCPVPPTTDKPHQFRHAPHNPMRCLCGQPQRSAAHPGTTCICRPEDKTACSDPACAGLK